MNPPSGPTAPQIVPSPILKTLSCLAALALSAAHGTATDAGAAASTAATLRPAAGADSGTVRVEQSGPFFTAREQASRHEVLIPLPAAAAYRRATIRFRVRAPSFPGPALHSIVALMDPAATKPEGRYFAMQHTVLRAAEKGVRTNIDNLVGGTSVTKTDVLEALRTGRAVALDYTIIYDTAEHAVQVEIVDGDTGTKDAFRIERTNRDEPLVEEDEINAKAGHLVLSFGLDRIYDHGGYYPPYGWRFSDLSVEFTVPVRKD